MSRSLSKKFLFFGVAGVLLLIIGFFGTIAYADHTTKLPVIPTQFQNSIVYASDGKTVLGIIPGSQNRIELSPSAIPGTMKDAIIASEDKNFYAEQGVSFRGMARAFISDVKVELLHKGSLAGGSTLEQQYVKNALLTQDKTLSRKVNEIGIARKLDKMYSKDQILAMYLNTVYFGRGAYGVQSAAQAFFGENASQLNVAQASTLAALVQAPSTYSQPENASRLLERRNDHVLSTMVATGKLSQADYDTARAKPLGLIKQRTSGSIAGSAEPYLADLARQYVLKTYGDQVLAQGGLKIYTTINANLQKSARKAVLAHLPSRQVVGAMAVIRPSTGAVAALANSTSYASSQFNLAVQAARQVGSAMKPFVLADAISRGVSPKTVLPAPAYALVGKTKVYNDDGRAHGYLSMSQALATSNNPWHIQLMNGTQAPPGNPRAVTPIPNDPVSPTSVAALAHKLGLDDTLKGTDKLMSGDAPPKLDAVPELALGTSSITPLQLASAYGTWANGGTHHTTYFISRIVASNGGVLEKHQDASTPVMDAGATAALTRIMTGVLSSEAGGTAAKAALPNRPAAGKTGTTNFDAWFAGFTPQYVAAAWTGYADNRPLRVAGQEVFGGSSAALMWHDFMSRALDGKPVMAFPQGNLTSGQVLGARPTPTATPTATATLTPLPGPTDGTPTAKPTTSPTASPTSPPPSETPLPTSTVTD